MNTDTVTLTLTAEQFDRLDFYLLTWSSRIENDERRQYSDRRAWDFYKEVVQPLKESVEA